MVNRQSSNRQSFGSFNDLQNDLTCFFQRRNRQVFVSAVEVLASGEDVRAGQSLEGKSCAVCSATDRFDHRRYAYGGNGFFGEVDDVHYRFDFLTHVVVLVTQFDLCGSFAVLGIDLAYQVLHLAFAVLELCAVVVTDDVVERRLFHGSAHADEMIEALITLGMFRCLETRQHDGYLIGYTHGVAHFVVGCSRVHIHAVDVYLATGGVEVLELQFAYGSAVHGVGKVATKGFDVEMVGSLTYLLVRCESHTHFAVLDLRVFDQVFHGGHYLGYSGFVVGSEEGLAVGDDDVLTLIAQYLRIFGGLENDVLRFVQNDVFAVIGFDNTGLYVLPLASGAVSIWAMKPMVGMASGTLAGSVAMIYPLESRETSCIPMLFNSSAR